MNAKANKNSTGMSRRRLLQTGARAAAGAVVGGVGLFALVEESKSLPALALRPPGALDEKDFLAACVRCGLCVRACPFDTLKLARFGDGVAAGSPYFTARDVPCFLCDDIPCVVACPTGALDTALTDIEDARMGVAVIVSRDTCLNLQGFRCDVCYRECPLIDKAITLELSHNTRTGKHAIFEPYVHADVCTGCGICEKRCVLEEAAIKVLPLNVALGRQDEHYRRGWVEKEKAGEELVPGIIDLPDRGFED